MSAHDPLLSRFKRIKAFVFDIDGVFTNSHLYFLHDGHIARTMNIKDGYAMARLMETKAYKIAVISGGGATTIKTRLEGFGIRDIYLRCPDKKAQLTQWCERESVNLAECLYVGDDVPDIACMQMVGVATCPADAATDVLRVAHYISPFKGGEGCVRDVVEKVLKLNGRWAQF